MCPGTLSKWRLKAENSQSKYYPLVGLDGKGLRSARQPVAIGRLLLATELDYLVIGHVTRDLVDANFTIGGTVSFAARTALALGCRVGAVTSASPDLDLDQVLHGVLVARFPAAVTTTFENIYTTDGRRQKLHGVAGTLMPGMVPPDWQAAVIHLGPVVDECDPSLVDGFGGAFVGVTPQGWMRQWDGSGWVRHRRWEEAAPVLARADAVVLSQEDLAEDEDQVAYFAAQARLLVVTRGARGCTVYAGGRSRHFPVEAVDEVDPTGAGDVFAAVFFVSLHRCGDPWLSARVANCVAARSVTRRGLASVPTSREVAGCREIYKLMEDGEVA